MAKPIVISLEVCSEPQAKEKNQGHNKLESD